MTQPNFDMIGATGLNRQGGYVYEEFLRELQGHRWTKTVKEMSEQDPLIGAVLFAIEMLIRQVDWDVAPADKSNEAKEVAAFVDGCLEDMSMSWPDTLSEILTFLPFGWAYQEIVYKRRDGESRDPSRRSKFDDGRIGWRKWSIRAQDTLDRWEFDEEGGIQGMHQMAPPDYNPVLIPIEKALLFRTTARKGNPEGRSVLRNAYRPWFFKKNIENIEGIGIERDLAGLPVAFVPPEIMGPKATAAQKDVFNAVKDIVVNIRRDEQEGVVFPAMYDDNGNKLYELTLLSTGGQRQFNTSEIINRYDSRIAMTVLADFILVGHEVVGSFALASSKTNLFTVALGGFLDSIAGVINAHAIPRLTRLNGINQALNPRLKHGDIESVNLEELGNYISHLSNAGIVLPTDELTNYLLQQANIPTADDSL